MEKQTTNSENEISAPPAGAALLPLLHRILLGDLTAGLVHDFNNPLTAILNYARLLQMRQFAPEEIDEFAKSIVLEGERMAAMTNRIGALAVAPAGRCVKLQEALTLALDLNKTRFRHDDIVVELPAGQNLPNAKLSLAGLLQLILPLLEQARQALNARAPEAEKTLRCIINESENRRQRLTIAHNGISSPEAGLNFLLSLFPNSPRPEQSQIAAEMTQALLNGCDCSIAVESHGDGWTAMHLDIPSES